MDASATLEGAVPLAQPMDTEIAPSSLTSAEKRQRDAESPEDGSGSRRRPSTRLSQELAQPHVEKQNQDEASALASAATKSPGFQTGSEVAAAIQAEVFTYEAVIDPELSGADKGDTSREEPNLNLPEGTATGMKKTLEIPMRAPQVASSTRGGWGQESTEDGHHGEHSQHGEADTKPTTT